MVNSVNNSTDSVNIVHSHDSDDDDNDDDNNNNSDNDTDNNNSDWKACGCISWQKVGNCNREPKQYKFHTSETDELVKKIISETRLYEQAI